jgi:hypothetical protein
MSVHDNFDLSGFLKSKKLLKESQEPNFVKDSSGPNNESHKWDNLEDEMKWELLLTAVKDPKEAEKYIELKWNNLPPEVQSNIDWSVESAGQELDENLESESEGNGVHVTGFKSSEIDSLYLTEDKSEHDELTAEGPVGSHGVIEDKTTGTKVYWSFGYK